MAPPPKKGQDCNKPPNLWGSAGASTTIYPPGTRPTQEPEPEPEYTTGWLDCEGDNGAQEAVCPPGQSMLAPQMGDCDELCDGVIGKCPKGKDKVWVHDTVPFLGSRFQYWSRGPHGFRDGYDCPRNKPNCMEYCEAAALGPLQRSSWYVGGTIYMCDKTGKVTVGFITDQGSCAPPGLP